MLYTLSFGVLNNRFFFISNKPASLHKAEAAIHIMSYAQLTRIVSTVLRQAKQNGLLLDSGEIGNIIIEFRGSMTMHYDIGKERW